MSPTAGRHHDVAGGRELDGAAVIVRVGVGATGDALVRGVLVWVRVVVALVRAVDGRGEILAADIPGGSAIVGFPPCDRDVVDPDAPVRVRPVGDGGDVPEVAAVDTGVDACKFAVVAVATEVSDDVDATLERPVKLPIEVR